MRLSTMPGWLTFLVALAASSSLFAATERCQIQSVQLRDSGTSQEWLSITTTRPPNFTSFKLSNPPRVVVDFAEATAEPQKTAAAGQGPIAGWSLETLGADDHVVGRLIVELREDDEYTLNGVGGAVELRLVPAASRPLTELAAAASDAAPPVDHPAQDSAAAKAVEEKRAADQAAAEKLRQEQAEQARREARARAEAEKAARIAAENERREQARREREAALAKAAAEKAAKLAALREAREARARALAEARAHRPATLSRIAFKRDGGNAQLVMHFSAPVTFATRESGPGQVMIDLDHTQIVVENNRRPLDTRFFGTPVTRIVPHEDRSAGRVSIEVDLSTSVPFEAKPDGATLTMIFHAPIPAGAQAQIPASPGLIAGP